MRLSNLFKVKKNGFKESSIISIISVVIVKVLGILYVIPFYQMIGLKGSSLYAYAYNIYIIFLDISSNGLPIAISKLISEYNSLDKKEASIRVFKISNILMFLIAIFIFILMNLLAPIIAKILVGGLTGGSSINEVTFVIKCIAISLIIVPLLSVGKGFLNGHKVINVSSVSQIIEQVIRISFVLISTYLVLKFTNNVTLAVGISLLGAFLGALGSYLYINLNIFKNKDILNLNKVFFKDDITNREIIKKIFLYSIPFVIINSISSLYNFVDMTIIIKVLNHLKFEVNSIEFISTSISTWAPKINMIITSIAIGLSVSLIPNIVSVFTLKKYDLLEYKINKVLQTIIYITLPCAIGISILSKEVWTIFYGYNYIGSLILSINIFIGFLLSLYMVLSTLLQSLNEYKVVYKVTVLGFLTNVLLDVPLILLFYKVGIPAYLGACVATLIGYSLSIWYSLYYLHKKYNISYKKTSLTINKMIVPLIFMIIFLIIVHLFIPIKINSKIYCLFYGTIVSILGGLIYLGITKRNGAMKEVVGEDIIKKLTLKGKNKSY